MILNQNGQPVPGPPVSPRPRLSTFRAMLLGALLATIAFGSVTVRLPLVTLHPGPTPSVSELVKVQSASPASGSLHITTVCVADDVKLVNALAGLLSSEITVLPRSQIYPPSKSSGEVEQENAALMDESKFSAIVAAFKELGYRVEPDGALIQSTAKDSPASKELQPGDVIVAVDGKPVVTRDQISGLIRSRRVGDKVSVRVRRGDETKEFSIETIPANEGPKRPVIGVALVQNFKLPFNVTIDSQNIGGPSAGLMFSVGIVDELDPADLTHGYTIAGTGTIDIDGKVGEVGGVAQKIAAAAKLGTKYFFAPKKEASKARAAAPKGMTVVGVSTLHEALTELRKIAQTTKPGKPPAKAPKGITTCG